ncbi:MAG: hypothetical protein ABI591_23985 [Kofleriaceae bacterium]
MKRSKIIVAVVVACVSLGAFVTACKQGKGDRCQIDDDCTAPLVCSKGTQICDTTTGTGIDASVPDAKLFEDAPDAM